MESRLPRKLAAILSADVAGYSRLTGENEDATHKTLTEYLDLISACVEQHQGQVVHYAGDAVLARFDAVVDAMSAVVGMQNELTFRNRGLTDDRRVEFRIGVNSGDVIEDRGDIYRIIRRLDLNSRLGLAVRAGDPDWACANADLDEARRVPRQYRESTPARSVSAAVAAIALQPRGEVGAGKKRPFTAPKQAVSLSGSPNDPQSQVGRGGEKGGDLVAKTAFHGPDQPVSSPDTASWGVVWVHAAVSTDLVCRQAGHFGVVLALLGTTDLETATAEGLNKWDRAGSATTSVWRGKIQFICLP